ncbi:PP-loop family-domain-containing protein [Flagelloscypha sp. PMI_526]|nr:PP-loop family-domain-containing protein [Flagelloscypha sp. PMI_526]
MRQPPLPISAREFLGLLERCNLPAGLLPARLAVATSGGPDSTCLLFLFREILRGKYESPLTRRFTDLYALSVNHKSQASSDINGKPKLTPSLAFYAFHILILDINWSLNNPKPSNRNFETVARRERYRLILDGLKQTDCSMVAFAHHQDDQIETSFLRIISGSGAAGAAGMRKLRRWGMGTRDAFYGMEGMNTLVLRPLLGVTKDRILATCDANNLEYVVDSTNFQPDLTPRNGLRALLRDLDKAPLSDRLSNAHTPLLKELSANVPAFHAYGIPLDANKEVLAQSVAKLSATRSSLETEAQCIYLTLLQSLPPPVGSCIFPISKLRTIQMQNPAVLAETISLVLRYLSPHPWGSPAAQSHRRSSSISRICATLLHNDNPFQKGLVARFCAGSGVDWYPVGLVEDANSGTTILTNRDKVHAWIRMQKGPIKYAWMASRRTPLLKDPADDLSINVTQALIKTRREDQVPALDVLFDNRFLVRFDFRKWDWMETIERDCKKVTIVPVTPLVWPQVVVMDGTHEPQAIHTAIELLEEEKMYRPMNQLDFSGKLYTSLMQEDVLHPGIQMKWIRPFGEADVGG